MRNFRFIAALTIAGALAGCINDGAALPIDGKEHSLSLVREQKWLWDKRVELYVVASRMPDCQRRHKLRPATFAGLSVEVFAVDEFTYHLRQNGRVYRIETQTCEGFQALDKAPESGLGTPLGAFRDDGDAFRFVEAPRPAAPRPAGS